MLANIGFKAYALLLLCLVGQGSARLATPARTSPSRRKLQNADYTLINSILGDLELELDTSGVESVLFENPFTTLEATFGDSAGVSGAGLEEVVIGTDTSVPGEYTINFNVDALQFVAEIGLEILCITNCNNFAGTPGTLTITSDSDSDSTVALPLVIEGDDFNSGPPTGARLGTTCAQSLDLSGIEFDAEGLGTTTVFIFIFPITIDLSNTVDDTLADDPSLGVDAIVNALCAELDPLIANLTDLIVNNPLTTGELFPPQSIAAALEKEQDLKDNLPAGTTLLDLNTLLPSSSIVLDDSSSIAATVLNLLGLTDTGSGWIVTVLENITGTDISGNNGELDFIASAASLLGTTKQGVLDLLQFEFEVPGSIEVNLSTVDASASLSSLPSSLLLELPGTNTLSLSGSAGDISISGEFNLDLFVDVVIFEQTIQVDLSETISIDFVTQSVSAQVAGLLPLDGGLVTTVAALLALLFDTTSCTPGIFAADPSISASILAQQGVTVGASGVQEAILFIIAEVISAALPVYAYVVTELLGGLIPTLLNPVIADLVC